jgi:CDP-diacylglycerol--glycerol-3-phosphate 3-phosphatidyltransferase
MVYLSASSEGVTYRYVALIIFLIASLTDFLDGYLARKLQQESYLGRLLDVSADKFLVISSVIIFTFLRDLPLHLPLWVAIVILLRDILVIVGVIWLGVKIKKVYIKPNIFGKFGIAFKMLMIISVLLVFEYSFIIWQIAAFFAVISVIVYAFETQKLIREL